MNIFTENLYKKNSQNIAIKKKIVEKKSLYQNILIFDSKYFGRVMTLDKVVQITEHDHHGYSEMLTHLPILSHGNIKKVLITCIDFLGRTIPNNTKNKNIITVYSDGSYEKILLIE